MMDPNWTRHSPSSPRRPRPVFPPAPAIPTWTAASYLHGCRQYEPSNEPKTHPNARPQCIANDSESALYTASCSQSRQDMSIPGGNRQVPSDFPAVESVRRTRHSSDILLKYLSLCSKLTRSFSKRHHPIPLMSPMVLSRNISYTSLPNSHFLTPDISDGGLATSTQRLAINSGHRPHRHESSLFGHRANPINLPRLDSFLAKLKRPSFSPWTDVLRADEIAEYQLGNVRKFPLLHLIPHGLSLSDLKSNKLKRDFIPGVENDCWRFIVDVAILTAGSPYGKYINVDIFRLYIRGIVSLFVQDDQSSIQEQVLNITGGGSLGLVVVFLISLLLTYKCRLLLGQDHETPSPVVSFPLVSSNSRFLEAYNL